MTTTHLTHSTALVVRNVGLALLLLAGTAWASSIWWWPAAQGYFLPGERQHGAEEDHDDHDDHDDHGDHGDHGTLSVLKLSDEAVRTLGIDVGVLKRSTYERVIPIPGHTVVVPGTGRQEVTTPSSGTVTNIFVQQGEMVRPRQRLFEIKLLHDEGIKVQVELLDSLAEKEVVNAEIERLQDLERRAPGAVAGTRILESIYKRRHLNHMIASRRQMLILLGLPANDVDRMITEHIERDEDAENEEHHNYREKLLLETITVSAPEPSAEGDRDLRYLIEKLTVVQGQHVDAGDVLCRLGDYRTLFIEGEAFERDLQAIRAARDKGWPISAAIERRGEDAVVLEDLLISGRALEMDAQSRSARFFVPLENELIETSTGGQSVRPEWRFRPGQRMELRVPAALLEDSLKVPVEAVARDGLDNYIFQVSGNTFVRRKVTVRQRDEDFAVIAESPLVTAGVKIAMSGAYQLQLALLNKSADPAAAAHGHAH